MSEYKLPPITVDEVVSTLSQSLGWGLKQLNVPDVWSKTTGDGVTIGVVDTGYVNHVDVGDNVIAGEGFIPGEDKFDNHGHQTHCVGIICAKNNDQGMVGVAPNAKIVCAKGLSNNGSGSANSIIKALRYCLDQKVDIVSLSLGSPVPNEGIHDAVKALVENNIPVICAAGNSGNGGVNYPAAFKEAIAVAAFDSKGNVAGFSSKGEEVDIAAPGVGVYSTYLNNRYASMNGTSMACPFVAGVVALMISDYKKRDVSYTIDDIKSKLIEHADDKGAIGKDDSWGYGMIDVDDMLLESKPEPKPEPEPKPKPEPAPEPKPGPKPPPPIYRPPEPRDSNKIIYIVLGVVAVVSILFAVTCSSDEVEIPEPPYIDEQGNVDWDKKFELESK